jgi:hypothetical protein
VAKDSDNIKIAANGSLWVAPVGSTLPVDATTALNVAFVDVGYLTEDGITITPSQDMTVIRSWQSYVPTRRVTNTRDLTVAGVMQEFKRSNLVLAMGGGSTGMASGIVTYTPPSPGGAPYERAVVVEWQDGTAQFRLVVPRMLVSELGAITLRRSEEAKLPFTLGIIDEDGDGGFLLYGEDAEFVA